GSKWGGFGDLTPGRNATSNVGLMTVFAAQAQNPHWQWYVEQLGGPSPRTGYIGFVRGVLPPVKASPPDDLPTSRLFRGTGQAYLNTTLKDAKENVQVVFKSSPFGTQSHGYEANNSFILSAYGEPLLIQTGRRDNYGSPHHRDWMWSTRSVNNITVNGMGQVPHSATSKGEITAFHTTPDVDVVVGEAGGAYRLVPTPQQGAPAAKGQRLLDRFTRAILFVKPDLIVIYDRLVAREPSTFEYWLHAANEIQAPDQHNLLVTSGEVACGVDLMTPTGLSLRQTNQYDPNPQQKIRVREWHLTASTTEKQKQVEFVAVCTPRRPGAPTPPKAALTPLPGGYVLRAKMPWGDAVMLLPSDDQATLTADGLRAKGALVVEKRTSAGATRVSVP
ncbi:MAG: heparinase II/III family protein, partial [Armatimonadota bacterium]|nr:heparinase II/III family protein [Armatimonadota bacterium]